MNKISFDFKNRTALVTGGAQGFGLDIAKRLLKSGAKVIIWDIDSKMISYKFNKTYKDEGKFFTSARNLFSVYEFLEGRHQQNGPVDLLINPSCEHMYYMKDLLKKQFKYARPLCVFQSTDNDEYDDHINCVKDPEELADQANLIDIKYMGTKKLSNGMNRFMVIGR